jgi:hypothetical protein
MREASIVDRCHLRFAVGSGGGGGGGAIGGGGGVVESDGFRDGGGDVDSGSNTGFVRGGRSIVVAIWQRPQAVAVKLTITMILAGLNKKHDVSHQKSVQLYMQLTSSNKSNMPACCEVIRFESWPRDNLAPTVIVSSYRNINQTDRHIKHATIPTHFVVEVSFTYQSFASKCIPQSQHGW